jgi:hypothetical protein
VVPILEAGRPKADVPGPGLSDEGVDETVDAEACSDAAG